MTPPGVVPAFDPGEHCQAGFGTGFEGFAVDEFALETSEEALSHGVVVRIADRSHGRLHTHLAAAVAKGQASILAPLVAMMNDMCRGRRCCKAIFSAPSTRSAFICSPLASCRLEPTRLSAGGIQPDRGDVFWACGLLKIKILSVHEKESTPGRRCHC